VSWDIFVQDLPPGIASIDDIPEDFEPSVIGLRSEVIAKVSALYPEANFKDPSWGVLDLPGCSIELNLGSDEELDGFAFHVRGDERAPTVVAHILGELGMRALDLTAVSSSKMRFCGPSHLPVGNPTDRTSSEIAAARPAEAVHVCS
jgi:hypothetical protein